MTETLREMQEGVITDQRIEASLPTNLSDYRNNEFDIGADTGCQVSCNSTIDPEGKHLKNCTCEIGLQGFECYSSKLSCSQRNHVRRLQQSRNGNKQALGSRGRSAKSRASPDKGTDHGSRNSSRQRNSSPSPPGHKRIGNIEASENNIQLMEKWKMKDATEKFSGSDNQFYTATKQLTKGPDKSSAAHNVTGIHHICQGKKRLTWEEQDLRKVNATQPVDKSNYKLVNNDRDTEVAPTCPSTDFVIERAPVSNLKKNQSESLPNTLQETSSTLIDNTPSENINVHYFAIMCQKQSISEKSSDLFDNTEANESHTNFRKTNYLKMEEQHVGPKDFVNAYFVSSSAQTSSPSFQRWSSKNDCSVTDEALCEKSQCTQEETMKSLTEKIRGPLEAERVNSKSLMISPTEKSIIVDSGDYEHSLLSVENKKIVSIQPVSTDAILDYCDAPVVREQTPKNNKDCTTQLSKLKPKQKNDPSVVKKKPTRNSDEQMKLKKNICESLGNHTTKESSPLLSTPLQPTANADVCIPPIKHDKSNETNQTNPKVIHNHLPENNKKCQQLNSTKMANCVENLVEEDTKQNPRLGLGNENENGECFAIPKVCNDINTNLPLQSDKPRVQSFPSKNSNVSFSVTLHQTNNNKNENPVIHTSQNDKSMEITVEVSATSSINSLCPPEQITVKGRTKSAHDPYFKHYEQFGHNTTTRLLFQYDFNKDKNVNTYN